MCHAKMVSQHNDDAQIGLVSLKYMGMCVTCANRAWALKAELGLGLKVKEGCNSRLEQPPSGHVFGDEGSSKCSSTRVVVFPGPQNLCGWFSLSPGWVPLDHGWETTVDLTAVHVEWRCFLAHRTRVVVLSRMDTLYWVMFGDDSTSNLFLKVSRVFPGP